MKIILTDAQTAAIIGGATFASLGFSEDAIAAHNVAMQAETAAAAAAATAAAAAETPEQIAAKATAEAARVAAAAAAGKKDEPDVMATLLGKVETQAQELARLGGELTTTKAKMTAMESTHDSLLAIAREATAKMLIPMGGSAAVTAAMDAPTAVAEYAKTKVAFEAAFPIGGKGKGSAEVDEKNTKAQIPPQFEQLARTAAAARN